MSATWTNKVLARAHAREAELKPFMEGLAVRGRKPSFEVAAADNVDAAAATFVIASFYGASEISGTYDGPGVYRFTVELTSCVELVFQKEEP